RPAVDAGSACRTARVGGVSCEADVTRAAAAAIVRTAAPRDGARVDGRHSGAEAVSGASDVVAVDGPIAVVVDAIGAVGGSVLSHHHLGCAGREEESDEEEGNGGSAYGLRLLHGCAEDARAA